MRRTPCTLYLGYLFGLGETQTGKRALVFNVDSCRNSVDCHDLLSYAQLIAIIVGYLDLIAMGPFSCRLPYKKLFH